MVVMSEVELSQIRLSSRRGAKQQPAAAPPSGASGASGVAGMDKSDLMDRG